MIQKLIFLIVNYWIYSPMSQLTNLIQFFPIFAIIF